MQRSAILRSAFSLVLAGAIWCAPSAPSIAQPSIADFARPTAKATRIEADEAPKIDGDLSDAVWAKAAPLDDFRQTDPNPGMPGSERTVVRILYDQENLYVAVYNYDSAPDQIVARTVARDGAIYSGDVVRIELDPGMTRRDGYGFEVGPTGQRRDGLLQNNALFVTQWNPIWQARAARVADGWVAELAIPFRSISYSPGQSDWGFDFIRYIRRKNESIRWTSFSPNIPYNDISQSGTLTGISNLRQGLGLDLQLQGRLSYKEDWNPRHGAASGTAGATGYYKVTPALTGTVTLNPDFSDSPLSDRQVNTSQFSLFTPETRDFFLQDAATFEFGGRGFLGEPNASPFFSRNIGLAGGDPVALVGGGKLSGQHANSGVGALSVLTNRSVSTPGQVLSAVRITRPAFAESKFGVVLTNGDPGGLTRNTVAGTDLQYRDSHLTGNDILQSDFYYERSFSSTVGQDDSFGVALNYPNEPWGGNFRVKEIGANFTPALGFLNRSGIRAYDGGVYRTTRFPEGPLRQMTISTFNNVITGLDGRMQSRFDVISLSVNTRANDNFGINVSNARENVPEAFSLPRDVVVAAGAYEWSNAQIYLNTSNGRPYGAGVGVECCSDYNGRYLRANLGMQIRPNDLLEFLPSYSVTLIDLPTGYVAIHILSTNMAVNFTPDMQLAIQAQFDNISRNFGFSARYRWEYKPGAEIFAGFGQSAVIPGTDFIAQSSQFSVRLGNTLRF